MTKVPVQIWNNRRIGWFCMDGSDFGQYQQFVESVCAKDQNCVEQITTFVNNLKK